MAEFKELVGQTLVKIEGGLGTDEMTLYTQDEKIYRMYHDQDCCESVTIEDLTGDLDDLLNTPILSAEEVSSETKILTFEETEQHRINRVQDKLDKKEEEIYQDDSQTWTYYRISTIKGTVVIRWYGTSNGYYSESVSFVEKTN